MKRYIALLRGINISGKNKLVMKELKEAFIQLGYKNVITYLNSGNVIFSSNEESIGKLTINIEQMIFDKFNLNIPVNIVEQNILKEQLTNAPTWWDDKNKDIYDNLIFLLPDLTYEAFIQAIGPLKEEYEKAYSYQNIIFWSFLLSEYQKTNWWKKTVNSSVSNQITIRTANTVKKIINL